MMALPPPVSSGRIVGLWETLRTGFSRLTGTFGPTVMGPDVMPVIPLPMMLQFMGGFLSDTSISAALSGDFILPIVPSNERWLVLHLRIRRSAGDNTLTAIQYRPPAGYRSTLDLGVVPLYTPAAAFTDVHLPRAGSVDSVQPLAPWLWEPGTQLRATASGAGVAATTFRSEVTAYVSRVVRASPP